MNDDDDEFQNDPLANQYREFGAAGKQTIDPSNAAASYVRLGCLGAALLQSERSRDPDAYDRSRAVAKLGRALELAGVPESMVRPQEILSLHWVAKLDRSTPGPEHGPRSMPSNDETPADWYGGNITVGALRVLATCISRASKANELDVWEYKPNLEATSRDLIKRLRRGEMSLRQVDAMLKARRAELLTSHSPTHAKIMAVDAKEKELGKLATKLAEVAVGDLGKSQAEVRDYLESRQIIAPVPKASARAERPPIKSLAKSLTASEARELIQELAKLLGADPSRKDVLVNIGREVNAAIARMREGQPATHERRPLPLLQHIA